MAQINIHVDQQSVRDTEAFIKQETERYIKVVMDGMCEIGQKCVQIAKNLPQGGNRAKYPAAYVYLGDTKPNYTDWTTNLRESISWAVLRNGVEYKSEIGNVQNAQEYYNELKSEYSNDLVLLVMATGQDPNNKNAYAGYVQALGYDVLASSQLEMEAIAEQTIQKLIDNA